MPRAHYSKIVKTWIREHNSQVKQESKGVRILPFFLPTQCVPGSTRSSPGGCMPRRLLWNPMACLPPPSWLNAFVFILAVPMNPIFPLSKRSRDYALVEDFPRVWKDSRTSDRDRKRMVRWLLEDVTVLRGEEVITAHMRFKGGATQTITVPVSRGRCSSPELIALVDQFLSHFTHTEVAH